MDNATLVRRDPVGKTKTLADHVREDGKLPLRMRAAILVFAAAAAWVAVAGVAYGIWSLMA